MPAAAVIPAPVAYIKVVAVKKLVVEFTTCWSGLPLVNLIGLLIMLDPLRVLFTGCFR